MENNFGNFLKQKRQEKNLTQKELATELFVSESAVSKWEKNVARPDISLLPRLSEILGVSEHELITASTDKVFRQEKLQAKKWRTLSFSWSLFFYISYALAIIPCFICNLAIYLSRYKVFSKKKYDDFISIGIDYILLFVTMIIYNPLL